MFGIGFEEFFIIAIVLLIAVGPDKMPTFIKAVGKGVREFRKATRELKSSVGLDALLKDEDLRDLRRPIDLASLDRPTRHSALSRYRLSDEDHEREFPSEGVDLAHLAARPGSTARASVNAGPSDAPGDDGLSSEVAGPTKVGSPRDPGEPSPPEGKAREEA